MGISEGTGPGLPAKNVSRHGKITAVSMMKDEGPFLLEWVAHHIAVGFTDLVVYTNDCTDGTDDMLIRLETLGLAHHRRNVIKPGIKPQPSAIKHAQAEPQVQDSDWVMVFDADEFLSIRHGDGTLDDLLDGVVAAGANGIVITWRIFGSGGVVDWSRDFVTEQYLMAAPPMWNKGWGVKTLFRFDPDAWKLGIHRPKLKNRVLDTDYPASVRWLNGSGREMEEYFKFRGWRSIVRTVGYDWAQMNHYAVKSIDSYAIRKFRGNVNDKKDKYNDSYWSLQDRNEVRDDTMLRYSACRREIFEGLLGDPVLNRLHHAALERAEARLAEFKRTPDYAGFVAQLKTASAVPITQVEAKPPKERDPEKIAALMSEVEKRAGETRDAEKAKPAQDRALAPVETYVRGDIDLAANVPLDWFDNHSIRLPADPRVFTPPALLNIEAGKFERNLARNLPTLLPEFTTYMEIGAGAGFLATRLARERPDLTLWIQEESAPLHGLIRRIMAENAIVPEGRITLTARPMATDPGTLATQVANALPHVLLLGDPAITPAAIAALRAPVPPVLILAGRLWAEAQPDLESFKTALKANGYRARLPLDSAICAGWTTAEAVQP
ncbi:glycosyltransferase family 2 protein [Oceaniglobus indicus]|uniref:glycosyltransferase family 2 protein n=1 Tax=Oceaniglobus indicus TaxID=2047749 RepID=UPI001F4EB5E5|nr:glycosyltransferase family 2 protein [Oceaniglobus indicus]